MQKATDVSKHKNLELSRHENEERKEKTKKESILKCGVQSSIQPRTDLRKVVKSSALTDPFCDFSANIGKRQPTKSWQTVLQK